MSSFIRFAMILLKKDDKFVHEFRSLITVYLLLGPRWHTHVTLQNDKPQQAPLVKQTVGIWSLHKLKQVQTFFGDVIDFSDTTTELQNQISKWKCQRK